MDFLRNIFGSINILIFSQASYDLQLEFCARIWYCS